MNAIVGGTGTYSCASGYEDFRTINDTHVVSDLVMCGGYC